MYYVTLIVAALVTNASGQSTLRFDIFEEEQVPDTVADILRMSGLRDKYPPAEVATLSLEIAPLDNNQHTYFSISTTGMLLVSARLDRDIICPNQADCQINLDIQVQPFNYFEIVKVELTIMDKNDNTPSFGGTGQVRLPVLEGPVTGLPQSLPQATDPDSPAYSIAEYAISGQSNTFRLETFTGSDGSKEPLLQVLVPLDRETEDGYSLILYAIDNGSPRKTGSVIVLIDVQDANDEYPVFTQQAYEQTISEELTSGAYVITVMATDRDVGTNADVTYAFADSTEQNILEAFQIDATSGMLTSVALMSIFYYTKRLGNIGGIR